MSKRVRKRVSKRVSKQAKRRVSKQASEWIFTALILQNSTCFCSSSSSANSSGSMYISRRICCSIFDGLDYHAVNTKYIVTPLEHHWREATRHASLNSARCVFDRPFVKAVQRPIRRRIKAKSTPKFCPVNRTDNNKSLSATFKQAKSERLRVARSGVVESS